MPWRTGGGRAGDLAAITNPLDDDYLLDEILTRLPDAACLLQQLVLVSRSWCRVVVSGEGFLARFRARHPSSPLVGVFVDIKAEDHPRFYASPKPHIACAVRGTDKLLTRIQDESDLRWFVRDCRNGRLLLAEPQGSLIVYHPLSQRPFVYIGAARTQLDRRWKCLGHCLLELHGPAGIHLQANDSFRVISLQRQSGSRLNVRAVEYNSGTLEWHEVYPHTGWTQVQSTKLQMKPTYAAGHIFWQADATKLLVLDTSTMKFSEHAVPEEMGSTSWAIGELEDGKGCLVCIRSIGEEKRLRLEVWTLDKEKEKEGGDKQATFCCKREKDAWVGKMVRGEPGVNKVRKVVNGLAVIGNTSASYVIDLQSMTRVTEFPSVGDVYPYQMSWPPALAAATGVACRHLAAAAAAAANEEGNYTDGQEGTSSCGSESASPRNQLQVEFPDDIEDAPRDDENQHALASLGIGDANAHTGIELSAMSYDSTNNLPGRFGQVYGRKKNEIHEESSAHIELSAMSYDSTNNLPGRFGASL